MEWTKNTTIVILISIIIYFIREKKQSQFKSVLHNTLGSIHLEPQIANEKLSKHSSQFSKSEIVKVTDGIYVAIGYALANSIIIETEKSLIIVDTMESIETALQARKDFKLNTPQSVHNKPISTIIYTHYHPDHTFGTAAYIDDADHPPMIISHPRTLKELTRVLSISSSITSTRATRQFGTLLHQYDNHGHGHSRSHDNHGINFGNNNLSVFENSGIGPFLANGKDFTMSLRLPSKLLADKYTKLKIDNLDIEIFHAPGETTDQIFVYLPSKRVLLPADNIYQTFPNIYAIRGSPTRDARDWVQSLDLMRSLEPRPIFLVPCHTRPVVGEEKIHELLTVYRDGISYVHDQTVRFMNVGLTPEQMIPKIHENMPSRLRDHPYLQEFYGTIDWSIRGIFHSYLGWFSGDPADLFPLPKSMLGDRLISLVNNNVNYILEVAKDNIENDMKHNRDSCQWSLKLSTEILYSSIANANEKKQASNIKIAALQCLASFMTSANGRNYYLTSALEEISGSNIKPPDTAKDFAVNAVPMSHIIAMLRYRLKVELVTDAKKNMSVCHDFENKWFLLELRDGIIEIFYGMNDVNNHKNPSMQNKDILNQLHSEAYIDQLITKEDCYKKASFATLCEEQTFRDAISQLKETPAMLYATGKFKIVKGSIMDMIQFRTYFEQD